MRVGLVVLGATLSGCAAALDARRLGADVVLVADPCGDQGGTFGPRAACSQLVLRAAAAALSERRHEAGGRAAGLRFDLLFERAEAAVSAYLRRLHRRLIRMGVRIQPDRARFLSPREIALSSGPRIVADAVIVATGTRPRRPERFAFDGATVCDPGSLLARRGPLRNALVIGAEGTGCEVASILAAEGACVTLLDRRRRFLRSVDGDVRDFLHAGFREAGVEVVLGEAIRSLEVVGQRGECHAMVELVSGPIERCDCVVVDAGDLPATTEIELERTNVETDPRGFVTVDEWGRTSEPSVYAVGRVTGPDFASHESWSQGCIVARTALDLPSHPNDVVSGAWQTVPPIGSVGLTDEACARLDVPHRVGKAEYSDSLWASLNGLSKGLVKLVAGHDGGLLGIHVIGPRAHEIIELGCRLARDGETLENLGSSAASCGSGEMYRLAALDALGSAARGS